MTAITALSSATAILAMEVHDRQRQQAHGQTQKAATAARAHDAGCGGTARGGDADPPAARAEHLERGDGDVHGLVRRRPDVARAVPGARGGRAAAGARVRAADRRGVHERAAARANFP